MSFILLDTLPAKGAVVMRMLESGYNSQPMGSIRVIGQEDAKGYTPLPDPLYWQAIKTKPGKEAKSGDKVIFMASDVGDCKQGEVYTVKKIEKHQDEFFIWWNEKNDFHRYADEFLVLCEHEDEDEVHEDMEPKIKKEGLPKMAKEENVNVEDIIKEAFIESIGANSCCCYTESQFEQTRELPVMAIYFTYRGQFKAQLNFETVEEAENVLSDPEFRGCTVDIFERSATKRQKIKLENVAQ